MSCPRRVTAGPTRPLLLATLVVGMVLGLAGPVSGAQEGPDPVGVWPLTPQPEVVAGFDPPAGPYGAGHRGVDLGGHLGQVVGTALPGTVSFAGSLAGRGVVVVDHGATRTTYQPVTASVSVGEAVAAGATIGTLALPGSHCFPAVCLHWGWIEGETYLDPLRLVGGGPVRLLPLAGALAGGVPVPGPMGSSAPGLPRFLAPSSPYAAWRAPIQG